MRFAIKNPIAVVRLRLTNGFGNVFCATILTSMREKFTDGSPSIGVLTQIVREILGIEKKLSSNVLKQATVVGNKMCRTLRVQQGIPLRSNGTRKM